MIVNLLIPINLCNAIVKEFPSGDSNYSKHVVVSRAKNLILFCFSV